MLLVQKFHSIHEIDQEFIPSIELLLQEEVPNFDTLKIRQDTSPEGEVFTYFLFFGPTQNTPVGITQLSLKPIPSDELVPWHKKIKFWDKEHLHWKQASWQIGNGASGLCFFDAKFSRSGKDKVQELIKEYEKRDDIKAEKLLSIKGLQDFHLSWETDVSHTQEFFVLEPLSKAHKSYQEYIESLDPDMQKLIKKSWQEVHKKEEIVLGDYPSPLDTPKTFPVSAEKLDLWTKWGAQILTFEKDLKVLGCLLVLKGKNGNIFFEPMPFEPEGESVVKDELYTQYALLKFFEMADGRKCHMMKFGSKLIFENKMDLSFFQSQGFQYKTIQSQFKSRLQELNSPL